MTLRVPLEHVPGINRFVVDWVRGDPRATRFLPRQPWSAARPRAASAAEVGRRSTELVATLVASNRRWGLFVQPELERWASGQSITIVGGQQTGFAGGPL